jgi:hypothetical protein
VVYEREAREGRGGELVEGSSEQQIILTCEECGEKLVLFGTEEEWCSRYAVFACGYGHKLTLDGRAEEEVLAASELLSTSLPPS